MNVESTPSSSVYHFNRVEERKRKVGRNIRACKLPSPPRLSLQQENAVRAERVKVQRVMKGYNFTDLGLGSDTKLDDLVMERCGQPIKLLVLATWRSGSTFTGSLLSSHPAMLYEYEPLIYLWLAQVHGGELAKEALQVVDGMLSCNYSNVPHFDSILEKMADRTIYTNGRVQPYTHQPLVWKDPNFFSAMCRLSPFLMMKTVRLRLSVGKELLKYNIHNLRILHLVRDPRAVIQSRLHNRWCHDGPDCYDVARLCMEMEEDFRHAEMVRQKYPDRYLALRYEDISLHPYTASQKIYKFFRLQFHPSVQQFVMQHTTKYARGFQLNNPYDLSVIRDSRNHTFHWKKHFFKGNFSRVLEIQDVCSKAMELWGYPKFTNRDQLLDSSFVPLLSPPWPEMVISDC